MPATQRECGISQEVGEWLIWGTVAEGLGWPIIGDPTVFVVTNAAVASVLAAVIVGPLVHRAHNKRARTVARNRRVGAPSWAS